MRFSPRTWSLLSVLLFIAAAFFWMKGNELERRKRLLAPAPAGSAREPAATNASSGALNLLSPKAAANGGVALATLGQGFKDKLYPLRLRNTARSVGELMREDRALLLANALIDTAGGELEIPEHLRAEENPGTYIVQWNGAATPEFRALLARHEAEIVSYVPNNAYLVKAEPEQANALRASAGVQAVLPFEPYYKLEQSLLELAVDQRRLPFDLLLRVTLVPGAMGEALQQFAALGAETLAEESSPFGPQLIVRPPAESLASIARLPSVQGIEPDLSRRPSADFSRIVLGVATNSTASNYMDLTGSNVWVNINDISIDTNHPSLRNTTFATPPFPVRTNVLNTDLDGHGTFVANLIAGSGAQSPSTTNSPSGSDTNASFRGIAPKAKIFAQPIEPAGEELYRKVKDTWLIEGAAATNYVALRRTNSLISNNSWNYDTAGYDSAAARYDAAVRDALAGTTGPQPLLFVFSAGNSGFGDDDGAGGQLGRIQSPGSAKNVITVGALETLRLIQLAVTNTNSLYITNTDGTIETNEFPEVSYPFAAMTDSSNQVASFSSRGNVGIGIEGDFGRFKPDVVAPGTMLVSARSSGWNVTNSVDTNTPFGEAFATLQTNLGEYRFDSGTTFAAANVSGMLALIQEYFESQAPNGVRGPRMSPALMKALLINGARSLTEYYDIAVRASANYQGWGLPNLPNSLSSYSTNSHSSINNKQWRLRYADQNAADALATGESRTWKVTLSTNASVQPLRITLVWTDPPGNPAVGVKLVNDLDLIVTNTESGTIFYGNNFFAGSDFTEATDPDDGIEVLDFVNNVENVLIRNPKQFGREFTVTVRARRVNVNALSDHMAVTGRTNDVVQDFALVVASDLGADRSLNIDEPDDQVDFSEVDVFDVFDAPTSTVFERQALGILTNGMPLLTERVGANPTHFGTNGNPAQWRFYVFTNVGITNELITARAGSNVAFLTFNPPNLSRPREVEADIDVYISKDPNLTNLVPSVLRSALKSTEPGGTETVVLSNAVIGDKFYIGVKSEDQQAAEFSLMGVSTDGPFEEDRNGRIVLYGVPVSGVVLDGSPNRPNAATFVAVGINSRRVARTIVTNQITHENFGDLVGVLAHQSVRTVLNNHTLLTGNPTITNAILAYDDFSFGPISGSRPSDGPGTLADFSGTKIVGSWIFEMIDNAPSHTGRVESVTIGIDPLQPPLLSADIITRTLSGNEIVFYPIDVGVNVTNLNFRFFDVSGGPPGLDVYLRKGTIPQTNAYDLRTNVVAPGATFKFPRTASDSPISPDTYFLAIKNLLAQNNTFSLQVIFGFDNSGTNKLNFTGGSVSVRDDATRGQTIQVDDDKLVAGVSVGVNMPHPRSSDTVLSLISPQGTRILLAENRGYTNTTGFGSLVLSTNGSNVTSIKYHTIFTDDTNLARLPLKFVDLGSPVGLSGGIPAMTNGFERVTNGNYLGGLRVDGWDVVGAGRRVSVITSDAFAHSGSNLLSLGTATIRTNIGTQANQAYKLRFALRGAPLMTLFNTGVDDSGAVLPVGSIDPHYRLVSSANPAYPGPDALVFNPLAGWNPNTSTSAWIAPFATAPSQRPLRTYRYRTYINLYEQSTVNTIIRFKWAVEDDFFGQVFLNGQAQSVPAVGPGAFATAPYRSISPAVPGLNILDFVAEDGAGAIRVEIDPANTLGPKEPDPSVFVNINGVRRPFFGATNGWNVVTMDFVPTGANTPISFESDFGEVWLDSISVEKTGDVFVRPEEPLELLQGERALGEWRLEARDARTGAVLPASEVLSWKLDLNYAQPTILAERLSAGANFPIRPPQLNVTNRMRGGVLYTNQIHYFAIYPCPDASEVTVTLTGLNNFDAIEMLADHSGLPTGDPETDDFVPLRNNENPGSPGGRAVFKLTWDEPAPARLVPDKPFFLALRNRFINTTNVYLLRVDSDATCSAPPPPPLLAGQSVRSVASAASAGEATEGDTFEVNVASGAQSVSFHVEAEGDAMIVAQKGAIPTRDTYSHAQNAPGSGSETLSIGAASGLSAGVWYVRVLNNTEEPFEYTITAQGDIAAPAPRTELIAEQSNGAIRLLWNSTAGVSYRIESSSDLENWSTVTTVTASGGTAEYSDPINGVSRRFYRVARLN